MDAYEKVEIARNPKRKTSLDYIEKIFDKRKVVKETMKGLNI